MAVILLFVAFCRPFKPRLSHSPVSTDYFAILTTFGGLSPMIFETSRQIRFLLPMPLSLGYGILFATLIIHEASESKKLPVLSSSYKYS